MRRLGLLSRPALFLLMAAAVAAASPASAQQAAPLTRPATPLPPGTSVAPPPAPLFPNGASSIVETFADWTVDCRAADGRKICLLVQSQGDTRSGQRVFAIELRAPREGRSDGTILMPFGLKLENGAILKLDDKDLGQGVRFSTCVPAGCLLPVSFPKVATDAMTSATKLTVAALSLSSGEAVTFNVKLDGFAAALRRAAQLAD